MGNKIELFENEDYLAISNFVETKLPNLRKNKNFEELYTKLYNKMENFEKDLTQEKREQFNEIVKLFYKTEEYYLSFAYSLGVKYSKDIEKM